MSFDLAFEGGRSRSYSHEIPIVQFISPTTLDHPNAGLHGFGALGKPGETRRRLAGTITAPVVARSIWGGSQNWGFFFGGPHYKNSNILGSILGSPYFEKLPHELGGL